MERTNVWAKRAHSRDTRDSGDMKSETSHSCQSVSFIAPIETPQMLETELFTMSDLATKNDRAHPNSSS